MSFHAALVQTHNRPGCSDRVVNNMVQFHDIFDNTNDQEIVLFLVNTVDMSMMFAFEVNKHLKGYTRCSAYLQAKQLSRHKKMPKKLLSVIPCFIHCFDVHIIYRDSQGNLTLKIII